jgi:hypothetical protein
MHHFYRSGLARAVGSQKGKALAFIDVERNAVDGSEIVELFDKVAGGNGNSHSKPFVSHFRGKGLVADVTDAPAFPQENKILISRQEVQGDVEEAYGPEA